MPEAVLQTEADRYVIVKPLAKGGMGAIYLGKKVALEGFEKEVVLKELLPEFTTHPEFIELFLREARISATLEHANIVRTLDLVTTGANYFIVMEYVYGGDLRTILKRLRSRGRRFPPAAALHVGRELLSALGYAHDKRDTEGRQLKLIHRDISPSNIMISNAGEVKLADFGIAKAATHQSVFYRVKGKTGYMSPEQARADQPIDHRSDLYSLAVCIYEMLSGQRLFVADITKSADEMFGQPVPLLEEDNVDMPVGIDKVMQQALAVDPDGRFQNANEFQEALIALAYQRDMACSTAELAHFLHDACGPDPTSWHKKEPAKVAATELLPEGSKDLSGIELTSMLADEGGTGVTRDLRGSPRQMSPPPASVSQADSVPPDVPEAAAGQIIAQSRITHWEAEEEPTVAVDEELTVAYDKETLERGRADSQREVAGDSHQQHLTDAGTREFRPIETREHHLSLTDVEEPQTSLEQRPEIPAPSPGTHRTQRTGERQQLRLVYVAIAIAVAAIGAFLLVVFLPTDMETAVAIPARRRSRPHLPTKRTRQRDTERPERRRGDDRATSANTDRPRAHDREAAIDRPRRAGNSEFVLTVGSSPPHAAVYVDRVEQCSSSCSIEGLDPRHVYLLTVKKSGYVSWSQLVDLRDSPTQRVDVFLEPKREILGGGYLSIRSRPKAEVFIDGKELGRVTSEGRIPLPPGRYEVSLYHPRRPERLTFDVEIQSRRTTSLSKVF